MRAVAFIPARGGSKRVPGKNLREVGGMPLLARAINAGLGIMPVDDVVSVEACASVVVSTDDDGIWNVAHDMAVDRHERPPQLASDHAQIEDALSHWWTRLDDKPDAIVLLQPTSPFRTAAHVREALRLLEVTGADSVVGVTVGHEPHFAGRLKPRELDVPATMAEECTAGCRCIRASDGRWVRGAGGSDPTVRQWFDFQPFRDVTADRPRTQDLRPMGTENGALYAFTREHWERTGNRMGGHMVALPMTRLEGLDVDTEEDLAIANALVAGGVAK